MIFVKNAILKMRFLLQKYDFENVNFLKYVILNILIFGSNVDFCLSVRIYET